MASLRARHLKDCALSAGLKVGRETAAPQVRQAGDKEPRVEIPGCTCQPVFSIRGGAGKGYDRLGRNSRDALRALAKRQAEEDEGTYRAPENLRFEQWADRWVAQLERPQSGTVEGYKRTVRYAKDVFGSKPVRRVTPADIADLLATMRKQKLSSSTQAQHLRVLGACFRSAVRHGYAAQNPIERLPDSERPRAERRESAYFTDDELPRLIAELPEGLWATLVRVALATGMREGEMSALTWGDCDLRGGTIRVRRTYSAGRVGKTKGRVARTVDLPAETVELLGQWWGEAGKPGDNALVFPREDGGGYQPFWRYSRGVLYPAMKRAGIPREGPTGEERTFHSTRHTYARKVLEAGIPISWLSRQLGHSSEAVTDQHYGHWSRARSQQEAQRLQGVFAL
jgi:integrase